MKRSTILLIIGAVGVITLIAAVVIASYVNSLTALRPLTITFPTTLLAVPQGAQCAGSEDVTGGIAKEILNAESGFIYVAGGTNPIPDDVWATIRFRLPIIKNSTRNLLFNGSCFFRSPTAPADCQGSACFEIVEIDGYTWLSLTRIVGQECFPDAAGCNSDEVNPGYISISTIGKCHRIVYNGPTIYVLTNDRGEQFVMHATADGVPSLTPRLPTGWTLEARTIDSPLEVLPVGTADACYHNVLRDHLAQSYHQFRWAGDTYTGYDAITAALDYFPEFLYYLPSEQNVRLYRYTLADDTHTLLYEAEAHVIVRIYEADDGFIISQIPSAQAWLRAILDGQFVPEEVTFTPEVLRLPASGGETARIGSYRLFTPYLP